MPMKYEIIEFREKYKDIDTVVYWIIQQAISGIPYCINSFPQMSNPCEIYDYFRSIIKFQYDPKGIELIQHPYTLFENNYHGIRGAGDCDCFSTLLLSYAMAQKIYPVSIMLYGRTKKQPTHIAIKMKDTIVDLTMSRCNCERDYKYFQELQIN